MARVGICVPILLSLLADNRWVALGWMLLAGLTDALDGFLARALNQVSDWGKIVDPTADKLGIAAVCIGLIYLGELPLWFVGLVILRDVYLFVGGVIMRRGRGLVLASIWPGKIAVMLLSLLILAVTLPASAYPEWAPKATVRLVLIVASLAVMAYSLIPYTRRWFTLWRQTPPLVG